MAEYEILEKVKVDAEWLQTTSELMQNAVVAQVRSVTKAPYSTNALGQVRMSADALVAHQELFRHIAQPVIAKTVRAGSMSFIDVLKRVNEPTMKSGVVDFDPTVASPELNNSTEMQPKVQLTDEQRFIVHTQLKKLIRYYGVAVSNKNTAHHPNDPDAVFVRIERIINAIA